MLSKLIVSVLSICLLSACLPSSQIFAQNSSRIAFVTNNGQIATINKDGTNLRELTSGQQRLQFPAWAPDGSKLAALGSNTEGGFVTVMKDTTNSQANTIYRSRSQAPFYMYWAPNSEDIAFLANHPSGTIGFNMVSESSEANLHSLGSPFYWQWTSDSQNIFLHSGFNRPEAQLGFSNRIRNTLSTSIAPAGRFQAPGISASGKYLAYATEDVTGRNVIISNNSSINPEELSRELPHQGLAALSWNPVFDTLAIMSPRQNIPAYYGLIQLLDAESGLLEPLSTQPAFAFFWSPNGRYLAYFAPSQSGGDFAQNRSLEKASLTPHVQQQVQVNSLSLTIVDTESMEETELGSFLPSPQFSNQFLPFFDQYALSHRIWSPQSDAIVLPTIIDNSIKVTVFDLDGTVTPIADGDSPFWNTK